MSEPTIQEVSKELTRPREQMNTHQAKYEGAFERLRTDMAQKDTAFERLRTDMAKRDADMAQRESNRLRWLIALWIGGVFVTNTVLGIFILLYI